MDTERNLFKKITAEAPFDGLRVVSRVEPQRAQRINCVFVGRRRQTKTLLKLELKFLPNRRLPIGQKGFPQRTWLSQRLIRLSPRLIRPLADSGGVSAVKCRNPYLR